MTPKGDVTFTKFIPYTQKNICVLVQIDKIGFFAYNRIVETTAFHSGYRCTLGGAPLLFFLRR